MMISTESTDALDMIMPMSSAPTQNWTIEQAALKLSQWISAKPEEVKQQKAALDHYGNYFAPENLSNVTQDGFKGFLLFRNNKHWSGIQRQPEIYADMDRLRHCLAILLDESVSIAERLDKIVPKNNPPFIKGLGRAVLTPILMCVYQDKYAVYNRISDLGLEWLGRNNVAPSDPFSKRYVALNEACKAISSEIRQPLYLIDSMFSLMVQGLDSPLQMPSNTRRDVRETTAVDVVDVITDRELSIEWMSFPMERYLEEFILANWSRTPLGRALDLHEEDNEKAEQYPTDVGPIDILARDKKTRDWVVIELKKGRDSDRVVGQLLRYMGWVKKHKASATEDVRGVIITNEADDRIKYAMTVTPAIKFYTYKVSFDLVEESAM